jgi:hypothetical protein
VVESKDARGGVIRIGAAGAASCSSRSAVSRAGNGLWLVQEQAARECSEGGSGIRSGREGG